MGTQIPQMGRRSPQIWTKICEDRPKAAFDLANLDQLCAARWMGST
jgi:hypothetical protein